MAINYIFSVLLLVLSFLLFEKNKRSLSIISSIIYTLCLLLCEHVVMVCFFSFFKLGGSLLYYSIFQYVVSGILFLISFKRKRIQKYYFDKFELFSVILIVFICFFITWIRFDGFYSISYASDDSAFHYKTSLVFSKVLKELNWSHYKDLIHTDFVKTMPMSYINGGFFIRLFSNISSFRIFFIYDSICFIMYTLLFFETIFKKKKYFFSIVMALLYGLSYPLNNLIFGFCYLGLGVMVINLLYYTIVHIENYLKDDWLFKIIILFILCFSLYYSYYLFVPFVYLSLGIYYIMLWKQKKLSFKLMVLYGLLTLIIPFSIGNIRFILSSFFGNNTNVLKVVQLDGDIYNNIIPVYFFIFFSVYFVYHKLHSKEKINYFSLCFCTLSVYVFIFFVLNVLGISGYYYFYNLFYIYFLFIFIYFSSKLMFLGCLVVWDMPNSRIGSFLEKTTIYQYNIRKFSRDRVRFTKDELKLVDVAKTRREECSYNDEFLLVGRNSKNMWFYEITGSIPVLNHIPANRGQLYYPNVSFNTWEKNITHPCVVVFYEDGDKMYDFRRYDILYSNHDGAIVKRKKT